MHKKLFHHRTMGRQQNKSCSEVKHQDKAQRWSASKWWKNFCQKISKITKQNRTKKTQIVQLVAWTQSLNSDKQMKERDERPKIYPSGWPSSKTSPQRWKRFNRCLLRLLNTERETQGDQCSVFRFFSFWIMSVGWRGERLNAMQAQTDCSMTSLSIRRGWRW